MSIEWFNVVKAAQVAVFFANKQGASIPVLKLVKLIYLADRKHMELSGYPILNDRFVSMPHGPVNSITYNYMNGEVKVSEDWDRYIAARVGHDVSATRVFTRDDLDELSDSEFDALEHTWKSFGAFTKWQLVDWTHNNCPEWQDPQGSAVPIRHATVLKHLGIENAEVVEDNIREERHIERLFEELRA